MYSAVLMLALTAGSESVDFGRNRCHGGGGGYGCSGVVAGCSVGHGGYAGGCHQRQGLFSRGHGCASSHGGYGCASSGHGCAVSYGCAASHGCSRGGLFGGHRNRGGCNCPPTCSTYAAPVCGGTVIVDPTTKKVMPKGEEVKPPVKKPGSVSAPATIVVSLPADARLIVDGTATTSTSERRTLVTPNLEFGSDYVYTMVAEVVREGRTSSQTQQVTVRGGQTANVQFNFPGQSIVSR